MNCIKHLRGRVRPARAHAFVAIVAAVIVAGSGAAAATVGQSAADAALTTATGASQGGPSGTTYTAGVPDGTDATVTLNGQVVWSGGTATAPNVTDSGGYIQVSGLTGTSTLGETR